LRNAVPHDARAGAASLGDCSVSSAGGVYDHSAETTGTARKGRCRASGRRQSRGGGQQGQPASTIRKRFPSMSRKKNMGGTVALPICRPVSKSSAARGPRARPLRRRRSLGRAASHGRRRCPPSPTRNGSCRRRGSRPRSVGPARWRLPIPAGPPRPSDCPHHRRGLRAARTRACRGRTRALGLGRRPGRTPFQPGRYMSRVSVSAIPILLVSGRPMGPSGAAKLIGHRSTCLTACRPGRDRRGLNDARFARVSESMAGNEPSAESASGSTPRRGPVSKEPERHRPLCAYGP
jgi:hypothetical protein